MRHACLKAYATVRLTYNPDRIKYPMKRIGDRGSGKWQRITWDEAMTTIADKIKAARAQYGNQSVWLSGGSSSTAGRLGRSVAGRLISLLECPNPWGWFTSGDNAPLAAAALMMGTTSWSKDDQRDIKNNKMCVLFGGNYAESSPRTAKWTQQAREGGTRLVYVGPVFNKTTAIADWFVPVNHNTDNALALSMMNVVINGNLYGADHIKRYTSGPLLVRGDTQKYLRESDIVSGGSDKNFVVWDTVKNAPMSVPPGTNPIANASPALLGTFSANGMQCKPAFQLLADLAAQYPPEKATTITGTPVKTIQDLAVAIATTPSTRLEPAIGPGRGYHGTLNCRGAFTLAAITGQMGTRRASALSAKLAAIDKPTDARAKDVFTGDFVKGIRDGTYPVKVYVNMASNKFWSTPNARQTWLEGVLPKLDLFATYEVFMTWTAKYSDIVLPSASTTYESWSLDNPPDHLILSQPLVAPPGEAKPEYEFWGDLANRLGFGQYFSRTGEGWIEELLSSGDASIKGITLDRMKKEGIVRINGPAIPVITNDPFATASGRLEIYNELMIPLGEALPVYKKTPEEEKYANKYPLNLITTRIMFFMQSMFANLDFLREIIPEPYLEINRRWTACVTSFE